MASILQEVACRCSVGRLPPLQTFPFGSIEVGGHGEQCYVPSLC